MVEIADNRIRENNINTSIKEIFVWEVAWIEVTSDKEKWWALLTLNLPTTTIVAQPFNVIKWQLKFNPVA